MHCRGVLILPQQRQELRQGANSQQEWIGTFLPRFCCEFDPILEKIQNMKRMYSATSQLAKQTLVGILRCVLVTSSYSCARFVISGNRILMASLQLVTHARYSAWVTAVLQGLLKASISQKISTVIKNAFYSRVTLCPSNARDFGNLKPFLLPMR